MRGKKLFSKGTARRSSARQQQAEADDRILAAWAKIPEALKQVGKEAETILSDTIQVTTDAISTTTARTRTSGRKKHSFFGKASDHRHSGGQHYLGSELDERNSVQSDVAGPSSRPEQGTGVVWAKIMPSKNAISLFSILGIVTATTAFQIDAVGSIPWKLVIPWVVLALQLGYHVGRQAGLELGSLKEQQQQQVDRMAVIRDAHKRLSMTGKYQPPASHQKPQRGQLYRSTVNSVFRPFLFRPIWNMQDQKGQVETSNSLLGEEVVELSVARIPLPIEDVKTLGEYVELPQVLTARGMDIFFNGGEPVSRVSSHQALGELRKQAPLLIVNGMTHIANVLLYFRLPDWLTSWSDIKVSETDSPETVALKQFLLGSDEYRDERIVIVPSLVDAPLPVKALAPSKTEILIKCESVPSQWYRSSDDKDGDDAIGGRLKPVIELELDMIASRAIRTVVGIVSRHLHRISLDLACLIYDKEKKLSACLSCFCFNHLDMMSCPSFPAKDYDELQPNDGASSAPKQ